MGRKINIKREDSILNKNLKYEKRKKERIEESLRQKEEEIKQKKRQAEKQEIVDIIDRQIAEKSEKNIIQETDILAPLRELFLVSNSKKLLRLSTVYPTLNFHETNDIVDSYAYHFKNKIPSEWMFKKVIEKGEELEKETKKQIREMFGQKEESENENELIEIEENEPFELILSKKKEEIMVFPDKSTVLISQNAILFKEQLVNNGNVYPAISSYFDYFHIENKEEQTIEIFRHEIVRHCLSHLERCKEGRAKGFTSAKILFLCPFVGDAHSLLDNIETQLGYVADGREKFNELDEENDFFRVGLKILPKKKQIHYFANFNSSDILVCSPVGLRAILTGEDSFLSSIEILYIDRASAMLMQNWSHLVEVLQKCNRLPKYESLKNSINDIRESYLNQEGKLFRQTIVFSEFNFPELNALRAKQTHNYQGSLTDKIFYENVSYAIQPTFYKFELSKSSDDPNLRLRAFERQFWPRLQNVHHVLLFAASYYEYISLKRFLQKGAANFEGICEHTNKNKVQSRLARFNNGEVHILLITERAYYFEQCEARRHQSVFFYSLPHHSFIYRQLLETVENKETPIVLSLCSKYDLLSLERIVGSQLAADIVRDYCANVSFVLS